MLGIVMKAYATHAFAKAAVRFECAPRTTACTRIASRATPSTSVSFTASRLANDARQSTKKERCSS